MNPTNSSALAFPFFLKAALFSALALGLPTQSSRAGSATWTGDSGAFWGITANWNPQSVPDGPGDIATFWVSNQTFVDIDFYNEVNSIVFQAGATGFAINGIDGDEFYFTGAGISNQSGQLQNFHASWQVEDEGPNTFEFFNNASAGQLTQFTLDGLSDEEILGGQLIFWDSSTAGSALINNLGDGGGYGYAFGVTYFEDNSSAENATIVNAHGGVSFADNSSAGHAMIINEGAVIQKGPGGVAVFSGTADSADSTIICNGDTVGSASPATVGFYGAYGGSIIRGRARIILHGNGQMEVSAIPAYTLKAAVGSIEGDGKVILGNPELDQLEIGTNNRNTTFAGVIEDSPYASGGSFRKIGAGTLTLTGANTYTGGTTVGAGQLKVSNATGSGTGTGAVQVNAGTLSGRGTIAGAVTLGTGAKPGAFLAPGASKIGTLTIQSELILNADGNYDFAINTTKAQADEVIANGVTINAGALFALSATGHRLLPTGTAFTAISNTAAIPIAGVFSNLADGSTITVGENTFRANYEGGDGNDLTLTVVP